MIPRARSEIPYHILRRRFLQNFFDTFRTDTTTSSGSEGYASEGVEVSGCRVVKGMGYVIRVTWGLMGY